jgi:hypothetical protein
MKDVNLLNNFSESEKIPNFLMCIDENDTEYVLHSGAYPCLVRINGIATDEEDDEEDDDDYGGLEVIDKYKNQQSKDSFVFDVEVFKITELGLKPMGRERSLKSVKDLIGRSIDYYIAQQEQED